MATTMIANLIPGDGDKPLEIKVIRKWVSFGRKVECCYIFLDKSGDAIEACSSFSERAYFDSIINVGSCYYLDNYMCEKEKTYFVSVPHKTRIKLGKAAKLEQIPGDDFPVYYFGLLPYDQLHSRLDDHTMLTDYIGKVEDAYKVPTDHGTTRLKLKLENQREKMVEATIWDDAALSFDIEALEALPTPVIAVVTSMKVTQYLGILQLTATPATYVYINPEIPEAASMVSAFVARDAQNPTLKIKYQKSKDEDTEKQRNRFTLAAMLSQNPKRYEGAQFTCKASLVRIDASKGWYYKACNKCRKKLQKRGNTLACEDHEQVSKPENLYFINAEMADETGDAKIVFFDGAATMLLKTDCNTMIDKLGYTDPHMLPAPLTTVLGQIKIFQMHFKKFCKKGTIEFVGDAVFEDTNSITQATATPSLLCPITPTKTSQNHLISTPITPTSTDTKDRQQTSVQKQLFPDLSIGRPLKKQKKDIGAEENKKTHVSSPGKST